ncbi:MAG: EpsI family protein [Acidobacteria bacterium]|nr:EpsI family protein [Acidobacteriota bacterium]
MNRSGYKYWVLIGVLVGGGFFVNWFETRGEARAERKSLAEIPATMGDWTQRGGDIRFSEPTERVLKTTDYVMRDYVKNRRRINLYIGYYESQKSGATYHSPQNCLPGSGWEMKNPELVEIKTSDGKSFFANKYIIANGEFKEVMIYWYQGRGRAVASEYYDKLYTVYDSLTRMRSDGSMIRLMTSAGNSEQAATAAAVDFASKTADQLSDFIPR